MERIDCRSALANVIDVSVYKNNGSHIAHFDIPFLIDLFEKVASKKNYICDIDGLRTLIDLLRKRDVSDIDLSMFLATQLSYQYALFSKHLAQNGESDFDWIYSFNDNSNSPLTIYGINNVISTIGSGIAEYCQRVGGNDLKQFFIDQLGVLKTNSKHI